MSEAENTPDPVETLEAALENAGDEDVVRAYVYRVTPGKPRVVVGPPAILTKEESALAQLVGHIQTNSTEGGVFDIKVRGPKSVHLGSARLTVDFQPRSAPPSPPVPDERETAERVPNPSAAPSPGTNLDQIIEHERKMMELEQLRAQRRQLELQSMGLAGEVQESGDDDNDGDDGGEDDEEAEGTTTERFFKGVVDFFESESGKMLSGRVANAVADRLEVGVEVARKKVEVLAAQAAGKIAAGGFAGEERPKPKAEPKTEPSKDDKAAPRVAKIHVVVDPPKGGGQAA